MRRNRTAGAGSREERTGGLTPAGLSSRSDIDLKLIAGVFMADTLDQDLCALKEWLRGAWRYLADPSSTSFERREIRNYMKDADAALRSGLKQVAARERSRYEAVSDVFAVRRLDFRILRLES